MSINLDLVIGLCRECGATLGESPPPNCASCTRMETRRLTHVREGDPYRKVWSAPEDEEGELLARIKNGTLFVPSHEELAFRHESKARYLLQKARSQGRTAEGVSIFEDALFHVGMAKKMMDSHQQGLVQSR